MRHYMALSLALTIATGGTAAYSWQTPTDNTPRYALITNTKPVVIELSAADYIINEAIANEPPVIVEIALPPLAQRAAFSLTDEIGMSEALAPPITVLPAEYDNIEARAVQRSTTSLGSIEFSTAIDNRYQSVDPTRRFVEGRFTIYATFRYEDMVDGLAWSWVWRRNNEVVNGGNALWKDGPSGPGYIYYGPEEGFLPGDYSLDVWINGELMTSADLIIAPGISAGN